MGFYNDRTLKVKDTFTYELYPINPPHSNERIVYAGLKDGKGEHIGDGSFITKKRLKIEDNKVTFTKSWDKPGEYWVGARLLIKTDKQKAQKEFNTGILVKISDSFNTKTTGKR